jgi:hypothetical protein
VSGEIKISQTRDMENEREISVSDKLESVCDRAARRVLSYNKNHLPNDLKEFHLDIINHELAWKMTLENKRLSPRCNLKELFENSCYVKDLSILNV